MVFKMPVNAPVEYFKAEEKFKSAKSVDEKIACLEEMIRLMPRHHGSENAFAQLKARLAKLKKDALTSKKRGGSRKGVAKEGDAQVCILGMTMSGKSTLLSKLTEAKPQIADHPYTTIRPEIGMMDYNGIKIQIVEIPSTFGSEYMSIVRTCDLIVCVIKDEKDRNELQRMMNDNFIKVKPLVVFSHESANIVKEKIWKMLDMIIVYTRDRGKISPMALPARSCVQDFSGRIHKDFIKHFRFAQIWRKTDKGMRRIQAGLNYALQDGDVVEVHLR
jgi:ribosome-interacting GTPase 1